MRLARVPLALFAASLLATPVIAQDTPRLSLEQQTSVRCSAAFAIVAGIQSQGGANEYPPLAERGREYFVRSAARLIDETGIDRAGITALMQAEAEALSDPERLEAALPACLLLLDASGL